MRLVSLVLLLAMAQAVIAADAAAPGDTAKHAPSLGTLIHDLRDFLPESEATSGNADDPIPAFSVKDDGPWKVYRSYNKNGKGMLSRTEIKVLVADLVASLRMNYPETFADIDTDGEDTITLKKFQAYQQRHR